MSFLSLTFFPRKKSMNCDSHGFCIIIWHLQANNLLCPILRRAFLPFGGALVLTLSLFIWHQGFCSDQRSSHRWRFKCQIELKFCLAIFCYMFNDTFLHRCAIKIHFLPFLLSFLYCEVFSLVSNFIKYKVCSLKCHVFKCYTTFL